MPDGPETVQAADIAALLEKALEFADQAKLSLVGIRIEEAIIALQTEWGFSLLN